MAYILAIESSCDDTSAAVLHDGRVLSNVIANQEVHRLYGGVVPEVASRAHQTNILPVVHLALEKASVIKSDIEAVAFTRGPGLMGSLIVGVSFAKAFALGLNVPLIEVNHLQAHALAHLADGHEAEYPFLCLLVSGGHTQIMLVRSAFDMEVLGRTIDDAAGEAFDKTGKVIGLDYPAGPLIDALAREGKPAFLFPEPQIPGLDFSFSGLKTSILYFLRDQTKTNPQFIAENLNDICASVQSRIISILLHKLGKAVRQTGVKRVVLAGGVAANSGLRTEISTWAKAASCELFIPEMQYCTDNAGMIATAAWPAFLEKRFVGHEVAPLARY